MAECDYCEIVAGRQPAQVIYKDDDVVAFVAYNAITDGQITIIPTKHFTILEMIPHELLNKLGDVTNKVGMSVFDGLGAAGTNILIQNGLDAGQSVPHFSMHVVPRKENDGLKLEWEPKEIDEPTMEDAFMLITTNTENLDISKEDGSEIVANEGDTQVVLEKTDDEEENYLIKSLRRRP